MNGYPVMCQECGVIHMLPRWEAVLLGVMPPDEQILLTPAEIEQIEAALDASPRIIPQVLDLRREFE